MKTKIFCVFIIILSIGIFGIVLQTKAVPLDVSGFAWSENIGWISMNSNNLGIGACWQTVNDSNGGGPDNLGSYFYTASTAACAGAACPTERFGLTNPGTGSGRTITSVSINITYRGVIQQIGLGLPGLADFFAPGTPAATNLATGFSSAIINVTPPGGWGGRSWNELNSLEAIIRYRGDVNQSGAQQGQVTDFYITVNYSNPAGSINMYPNKDLSSCSLRIPAGTSPAYGVTVDDTTGNFSGYAWARGADDPGGIGWVSFADFDGDGDVDAADQTIAGSPCTPNCSANLNWSTRQVSGWARALSPAGTPLTMYESHDDNLSGAWIAIYPLAPVLNSTQEIAQTFLATSNHIVDRVDLSIFRDSITGGVPFRVSIRATDAGGAPTGADLCASNLIPMGTLPALPFPPQGTGNPGYFRFDFTSSCTLNSGSRYAIVISATGVMGSSHVDWISDTVGSYGGGMPYGRVIPGGWGGGMMDDFLFQTYRNAVPAESPGGWDGWIKLRGTPTGGGSYGVTVNRSLSPNELEGWGWGDINVGWVSFNRVNCDTNRDGVSEGGAGCPAAGITVSDYKVTIDAMAFNSPPDIPLNTSETFNYCNYGGSPVIDLGNSAGHRGISLTLNWAAYSDPDGDSQTAYEVEVADNNSFTGTIFDHIVNTASNNYTLNLSDDDGVPDFHTSGLSWGTTYYWRVRVQGGGAWSGWSATDSFVMPSSAYPEVNFSYLPASPSVGQSVTFTNSSISSGAGPTYAWAFANGNPPTSTALNPTASFSAFPSTVALQVTDAGRSCSRQRVIIGTLPLPIWREIAPF